MALLAALARAHWPKVPQTDITGYLVIWIANAVLSVSITGFSSLSYLSKLPVDAQDRPLVFPADVVTGAYGLRLVSGIINLAHTPTLNVVAEGVATQEQLRLLRLLNCDEMRDYLFGFGKPVPVEIFERDTCSCMPRRN